MPWVRSPVGAQGNAWNGAAVAANGLSAIVDVKELDSMAVFGNVSASVNPMKVLASQDGVNFYTVLSFTAMTGNFGQLLTGWGARYARLQAGQAATITATIAGKF